ncbi:MAG: protein-glutamate O-methyltransferase CheR [Thermodesulfobacteriota bacterium]
MSQLWTDAYLGPLAQELYRRCGLVFEGGQRHLFRKRIERRAGELGYPSPEHYAADLGRRLGESEYERLIELLTVNETFFFREEEHFRALLEVFWPQWTRVGIDPIRVWSAASSTGCEPYTLGILLRERGLLGAGRPRVEILGTDLNNRVLSEAREGLYGDFSLRNTTPYYREKYFRKEGHLYRLDPEVRALVTFRRFNLLRPDPVPPNSFHAILCRNVLIYFDLEAKRRAVGVLARALAPAGVLAVGRSESLFNVPEAPPLVNLGGVMMHQKP